MITVLFTPWKTGSTAFLNELVENGALVIKEVFHEDRYEARSLPVGLSSALCPFFGDLKAPKFKYRISLTGLPANDTDLLAEVLVRVVRCDVGDIVVQVAESFEISTLLADIGKARGIDIRLAIVEYDVVNQACSIFHNYLEGNNYFVANAFLFVIFNSSRHAGFDSVALIFEKLSVTGMIQAASQVVAVMPRFVVLSVISRYIEITSKHLCRPTDVLIKRNVQSADVVENLRLRYAFISSEVRYYLSSAECEMNILNWLGSARIEYSFIRRLDVERVFLPFGTMHARKFLYAPVDRIFTTNLAVGSKGQLYCLDESGTISISACPKTRIYIENIILSGAVVDSPIAIIVDGVEISLARDCAASDSISRVFGHTSMVYAVRASCTRELGIALRCQFAPTLVLEVCNDGDSR